MIKATYKTSNLFSYKKYNFSNLNATSYPYPLLYGIRSAILGQVISLDGIEYANQIFNKIKNAIIYIKYPSDYKINGKRLKRLSNSSYNINEEDKMDINKVKGKYTMGYREFVDVDIIEFYIDNSIPNIELYLKNIDWLGTAESMVYLDKIEYVSELKNVMQKCNVDENVRMYEQYDWDKKTQFENIYIFSKKRKHLDTRFMCKITNINL